ncbi:helix-turn-helix domain-containing protein [Streptomyces sp. NBC_00285]|uniref:helix-turn-helix domain-containing protein n=1 Tax=Streptomyces sp. NBC_00285 TaxID=2975700 RepID=UPI002E28D617|nr:helix-turn-helix domain-containing protein [Streptomyces sp. NBC_00285]
MAVRSAIPTRPADLNAPYFDVREVAWLMKCSVRTVRRRLAAGRLAHSQEAKGGLVLISREDLARYYEANRIKALKRCRPR